MKAIEIHLKIGKEEEDIFNNNKMNCRALKKLITI